MDILSFASTADFLRGYIQNMPMIMHDYEDMRREKYEDRQIMEILQMRWADEEGENWNEIWRNNDADLQELWANRVEIPMAQLRGLKFNRAWMESLRPT